MPTVTTGPGHLAPARTITLATHVQRRRDFAAHLTGFISGGLILAVAAAVKPNLWPGAAAAILAWSTALSFQHFRHVLRGPVTEADVDVLHARLSRGD